MLIVQSLPQGKLSIDVLKPMLRSISRSGLVVAPDIGIDVGVTRTHGKYLISSSDPITGATERIGWHAVNVSANDVATSGVMPDTLNVVALFPERTTVAQIRAVMDEVNETAAGLGMTVAGGHTEISPRLERPIIMVTAFGSGDKFVTAADAKVHDSILMTKSAGIEGTSILAKIPAVAKLVGSYSSKRGKVLIKKLSITKDARLAFGTGKVHAMHDSTEGGVLGSLLEMSLASGLGFELLADSVPVDAATREICSKLSLDPLKLIGSGSLIISCSNGSTPIIEKALRAAQIDCTKIGRFLPKKKGCWIVSRGERQELTSTSIQDELWPALSKYRDFS